MNVEKRIEDMELSFARLEAILIEATDLIHKDGSSSRVWPKNDVIFCAYQEAIKVITKMASYQKEICDTLLDSDTPKLTSDQEKHIFKIRNKITGIQNKIFNDNFNINIKK